MTVPGLTGAHSKSSESLDDNLLKYAVFMLSLNMSATGKVGRTIWEGKLCEYTKTPACGWGP